MSFVERALISGQRLFEKTMIDACRIVWDPEGAADDDIDYDTGQPVQPLDDELVVYDEWSLGEGGRSLAHPSGAGGVCLLIPVQASRSIALQLAGGVNMTTIPYEFWLPRDSDVPGSGAIVTMTHSTRDPALVGRQFRIRAAQLSTMAVGHAFIAEERERVPE